MDGLKTGINLRGYGQMDPKVEYKVEGHRMFSEMIRLIREEVTDRLFKVQIRREDEEHLRDRWGDALDAGPMAPPASPPPAAASFPPPPPPPTRPTTPPQQQGAAAF